MTSLMPSPVCLATGRVTSTMQATLDRSLDHGLRKHAMRGRIRYARACKMKSSKLPGFCNRLQAQSVGERLQVHDGRLAEG